MEMITYNEILSKLNQFEFIIIDQRIIDLYPEIKEIISLKKVVKLEKPEKSKNIKKFETTCDYFLKNQITRKDKILAIGGGATSDLAGFVAASLLRGISWDVIPTTLLAMIDASIGGKVGINTHLGKNLIGAFHEPKNIYFCERFLSTLSDLEVSSGKGELIKYAFLDKSLNQLILKEGLSKNVIFECAKFKKDIVNKDLKESGLRKKLNFGHTFGHAIEKTLNISHGHAVYHGIEMILSIFHPSLIGEFNEISEKIKLNVSGINKMNSIEFYSFLTLDKKRISKSEIEFILPVQMGEVEIVLKSLDQIQKDLNENEVYSRYFE